MNSVSLGLDKHESVEDLSLCAYVRSEVMDLECSNSSSLPGKKWTSMPPILSQEIEEVLSNQESSNRA